MTAGDQKGPYLFPIDRGSNNTDLPTRLGNYPVFASTQASNNRSKGSATNLTYAILGNFKRAIVGRVGVLELSVSEHVKFLQDKTIIRAVLRNDLGLTHEESFVFCDTLLEA